MYFIDGPLDGLSKFDWEPPTVKEVIITNKMTADKYDTPMHRIGRYRLKQYTTPLNKVVGLYLYYGEV